MDGFERHVISIKWLVSMFYGGLGRSYRYRSKRVGANTDCCCNPGGKTLVLKHVLVYSTRVNIYCADELNT